MLSLRGGNEVSDAAIHRVSNYVYDLSLRLLVHSGSPRAFSPRDDKSVVSAWYLSLRGGSLSDRRGSPWCLGGRVRTVRIGYWLTVDRHGLSALAMTRCGRSRDYFQPMTTNYF